MGVDKFGQFKRKKGKVFQLQIKSLWRTFCNLFSQSNRDEAAKGYLFILYWTVFLAIVALFAFGFLTANTKDGIIFCIVGIPFIFIMVLWMWKKFLDMFLDAFTSFIYDEFGMLFIVILIMLMSFAVGSFIFF